MDDKTKEDMEKFLESSEQLLEALDKHSNLTSSNVGTSTIHINAGGIGVLITTGLAAFMAGLVFCLGLAVLHQQKQIDDLHDYLNVVYQYAPQLKPKDFK
jgi:hypothetical protein